MKFIKCILFVLLLSACQSEKKKEETPSLYSEVDIVIEAHKSELYGCYKKYLLRNQQPKNGQLGIQWKVYGAKARDVYVTKSFSSDIEPCLERQIRKMNFVDLHLGERIRIFRYQFSFEDGRFTYQHNN